MIKNKIKRISIISVLVVLLAGGLGFGVFKMVAPLPIFGAVQATQTTTQTETQAVTSDNQNAQEVKGATEASEVKGATEASESASGKEQGENLPGGGHQDQDNVNIDNQFEGVQ